MSPITPGLDAEGRVIISSRETAYKVNNLRRDPALRFASLQRPFTVAAGPKSMATRKSFLFPTLWILLVYLQHQVYGEHKSWPEFHERMVRERRVIIRFPIESVAPLRRG